MRLRSRTNGRYLDLNLMALTGDQCKLKKPLVQTVERRGNVHEDDRSPSVECWTGLDKINTTILFYNRKKIPLRRINQGRDDSEQ